MKLGFIGCGNMASAIIGGILKQGLVQPDDIMASAHSQETVERIAASMNIHTTTDNHQAAAWGDVVFLAVKPQVLDGVLSQIKADLRKEQIIVSIAAGRSIGWLQERLGADCKIIRTMPNTPALVGEAMSAICRNASVTEAEETQICRIFESFGKAEVVPEHLIDTVVGVSGSSPAYLFLFIEAMADAAVAGGMTRKQAYQFAAQSVLGSAKMVLETGMHPGQLKDMVCSPAGTTIEAVKVLEQKGLRSAVMEAMQACIDKSRAL